MKNFFPVIIFLLFGRTVSAQVVPADGGDDVQEHHMVTGPFKEGSQDDPYRMSVRAAATVPHAMSNRAFRRSFTGIYNITAGYYYQVFKGVQAGLQFEHSLWKTADNKIPGLNTYAQSFHGGLHVGYDRVLSVNSMAYVGMSFMEGGIKFYGLSFMNAPDPAVLKTKFHYLQVCADAGVFFFTEGNFAIGFHFGADFTNYPFSPYPIYLNQHKAYLASDLNGNFSQFNGGFNVIFSFNSNKPKAQ